MIRSSNFSKMCDCVLDPYYTQDLCIKENCKRIFVSGEYNMFERLLPTLKSVPHKYELVYHRTDSTFDRFKFESIKPYVTHVYAENTEIQHPMVTQLPLGFANETSVELYDGTKEKDVLCYVNLSLYNDRELQFVMCRSIRQDCLKVFGNKKFATVDEPKLSWEDFKDKMHRSKFVVCPVGYGIDTHRFYEAYACGATPIVVTSGLDPLYKRFGALIVDSWEDVTEELLNSFEKKPFDPSLLEPETYLSPIN